MTTALRTFMFLGAALMLAASPASAQSAPRGPGRPPPQAFEDCKGKAAGDAVKHTTPEGEVPATCTESPEGLVARPERGPQRPAGRTDDARANPPERRDGKARTETPAGEPGHRSYTLEQATSDRAQLTTIAFNGLAFITGSFGASTFIPPGKVADFFGFQYMRDVDAGGKGHSPQFLDRAAGNVLESLAPTQRDALRAEAVSEAEQMRSLALRRLPLIAAFHDQLEGRIPAGSAGLNREAVTRYGGAMFEADAALAFQRAAVFGRLTASLTAQQKAALGRMRFGDFNSWPAVDMERQKLGRGTEHLVNVAYMTLASEFFSWYAGSAEADTYFCPERHGTYFGGFYLKDAPAMAAAAAGRRDYQISTSLTGDSGEMFLRLLDAGQQRLMTDILEQQRRPMAEIVEVRRGTSAELRKFLSGGGADRAKVAALGRRYGELDGELAWLYATTFAKVAATLTPEQRAAIQRLRGGDIRTAAPAYLYSDPLPRAPAVEKLAFFFLPPAERAQ
ncbi:MAG: Spy/CpxP family protein refolding chaperone [Rhodospirillaceae bacterium]